MMKLGYTALSPFCRKVRMAMEFKGLAFDIVTADHVAEAPAFNPRAEVPVLVDGDTVVCNSPDILAYLDRKHPEPLLYPSEARAYAEVREWERYADTHVDAIITVIGNWKFAELPPMPDGLMEAARRDIGLAYDRLQDQLAAQDYVCGAIGAADFALYPHIVSGAVLDLPLNIDRHAAVRAWLRRMRAPPEGQTDLAAARERSAHRAEQTVDTQRVTWGTCRLDLL